MLMTRASSLVTLPPPFGAGGLPDFGHPGRTTGAAATARQVGLAPSLRGGSGVPHNGTTGPD
jgi:hypothetical protein